MRDVTNEDKRNFRFDKPVTVTRSTRSWSTCCDGFRVDPVEGGSEVKIYLLEGDKEIHVNTILLDVRNENGRTKTMTDEKELRTYEITLTSDNPAVRIQADHFLTDDGLLSLRRVSPLPCEVAAFSAGSWASVRVVEAD